VFFFASRGTTSDTEVMVGNKDLTANTPSQIVKVLDMRIHEEYDPVSRKDDIALLKV
jgi:hypothetical protein